MLLLQQMTVLFLLMAIGYICYKKRIITDGVNKKLSAIVVNVANPALVLTSSMSEDKIQGHELMVTLVLVIAIYSALLILAEVLPRLLHVKPKRKGTYRAMTVFSNIGFMGFPVIAALYGNGALLYAALFMIPYNVLIYTYGISAMKMPKEQENGEIEAIGAEKSGVKTAVSKILNIGVISCIVAIIIYMTGVRVPSVVETTVTHLSNLTAPLSMMVIGASLATMNLGSLFKDVKLILFSLIKLLVIPIIGVLLIGVFVDNKIICGVCMIMLATPVGSMTAMLAQEYDGDYEMASKGVALTTLLSVITMPLVSMLVG